MIGVFQASKSCWGETFSSFLSSDRGMRNRPSMSFHVGLPKMSETYFELQKSIVGNITSMHGGLKVLVNLGLVQLLFTRLGIPILSSIKSIKAGAKVRSRIHVSLINQFRVPRYIVFFWQALIGLGPFGVLLFIRLLLGPFGGLFHNHPKFVFAVVTISPARPEFEQRMII